MWKQPIDFLENQNIIMKKKQGPPAYSFNFTIFLYIRIKEFCDCSLVERLLEKEENSQSTFLISSIGM